MSTFQFLCQIMDNNNKSLDQVLFLAILKKACWSRDIEEATTTTKVCVKCLKVRKGLVTNDEVVHVCEGVK